MDKFSSILTVISIIVGIFALFLAGKFFFKFVGRDDNSIKFGNDAKVKDSFNKDISLIKKQK